MKKSDIRPNYCVYSGGMKFPPDDCPSCIVDCGRLCDAFPFTEYALFQSSPRRISSERRSSSQGE